MRQLGAGRPPSLLPFDSLLLAYPVTPAWRRQIAEAHSMRYVISSPAVVDHDKLHVDEDCTGNSRQDEACGGRTAGEKGVDIAHGDKDGATRDMAGNSSTRVEQTDGGRPFLNVGFIGHDFDEHPTAHMVEGVFVWQRRLARIRRERDSIVKAPETGERSGSGDWLTRSLTTPGSDCCRYEGESCSWQEEASIRCWPTDYVALPTLGVRTKFWQS